MTEAVLDRVAPGPKGKPVVGVAPDMRKDIIQTLIDSWRDHGDVVRFKTPFKNVPDFLFAHPDHVKHVLDDRFDIYKHPPFQKNGFSAVVGEGLVASQGEYWRRQRELIQPTLHFQRIPEYVDTMVDVIAKHLDRWEPFAQRGDPLDMRVEMLSITLDVVTAAMFGADWTPYVEEMGQRVTDLLEKTFQGMLSPFALPLRVPLPANRRFLQARARMDDFCYRLIEERRGRDDGTLLALLLNHRDADSGQPLTAEQIRDELMAMIIAGHETVSTCLTWTVYLLSKHPSAYARVRAEAAEVLADRRPTYDDVQKLQYTKLVLQESMRLYPPLWIMGRMPLEDDEIAGYHIPAHSVILLCQYVTHRHPDFWANPEGFEPERFTKERSQERPRHAYFPFGSGPRSCVGFPFALTEMPILIAMVARRYRLDLVPGARIAPQPGISLRARYGMPMMVERAPSLETPTAAREEEPATAG